VVKEHLPGIYMVMGDTAEVVASATRSAQAQDEYRCRAAADARGQRTDSSRRDGAMQVTRGILDKKTAR